MPTQTKLRTTTLLHCFALERSYYIMITTENATNALLISDQLNILYDPLYWFNIFLFCYFTVYISCITPMRPPTDLLTG